MVGKSCSTDKPHCHQTSPDEHLVFQLEVLPGLDILPGFFDPVLPEALEAIPSKNPKPVTYKHEPRAIQEFWGSSEPQKIDPQAPQRDWYDKLWEMMSEILPPKTQWAFGGSPSIPELRQCTTPGSRMVILFDGIIVLGWEVCESKGYRLSRNKKHFRP